jgi:Tfp pilus assembly protein PilX
LNGEEYRSGSTNNRGVILLNVIIIFLTIALIGASLMTFFFSVNLFARSVADGAKAFYLAEAGIASAVHTLRGRAIGSEQTIGPVSLGEGTYTVKIDIINSLITSTGRVGSTERTLQLQFNTL